MKRFVFTLAVLYAGCGSNPATPTPTAQPIPKPQAVVTVALALTKSNGGNAIESDFVLKLTSNGQTRVYPSAGATTVLGLDFGTYQIDVDASYPEGYKSVPCTVTVAAGSPASCTVRVDEIVQTCDMTLNKFVYDDDNDDRLKKYFPGTSCMSMTGTIGASESGDDNPDSDLVVDFRLDPDYTQFLNNFNKAPKPQGNDGFMVVEAICQGSIKLADVKKACAGFPANKKFVLPAPGTHVKITGIVVTDNNHHWNELHPITSIIVLPH